MSKHPHRTLSLSLLAFALALVGWLWWSPSPGQEHKTVTTETPHADNPLPGQALPIPAVEPELPSNKKSRVMAKAGKGPAKVILRTTEASAALRNRHHKHLDELGLKSTHEIQPRRPPAKEPLVQPAGQVHRLTVKFVDELLARATVEGDLVVSAEMLDKSLMRVVTNHSLRFAREHSVSDEELVRLEAEAIAGSRQMSADLAGMLIAIPGETDRQHVWAAAHSLQQLASVEYVTISSMDEPPPPPTPIDIAPPSELLTQHQTYRADSGILMDWAWTHYAAKGWGVRITNCEYAYNVNHEDMRTLVNLQPNVTNWYVEYVDHGTAVLGVLTAAENNYGMTGMVPRASVWFYPEHSRINGTYQSRAAAITAAITASGNGDVVLLEMQHSPSGNNENYDFAPAEYELAVWNAVKTGTNAGRHVVAAAGNGNQNLDASAYQTYLNRGDSGAIIVGAGSEARSKMSFSTYGSRVDLQGWGRNVATLGYGDLRHYGGDENQKYTSSFSGTSSASPIVASAVTALQSFARNIYGGTPLSPTEMRSLLKATGKPQSGGSSQNIGPLPDMKAAMEAMVNQVTVPISNNQTLTNISRSRGAFSFYRLEVPAGRSQLVIETFGGTGNCDLFVRRGAAPTLSTFDGSSRLNNNTETVMISNPQAGSYHIMIHAYDAFSGVSLRGSHSDSTRIIEISGNLTFGNVQVGQTATRTLTVSNSGNSALSVTGISYPAGFSGNWSSGSIPAGGSQNITVTFAPTAAQSYGGNVIVGSNSTSGTNNIPISGTGMNAVTIPTVTTSSAQVTSPFSAISGGNVTHSGGAQITDRGVRYSTSINMIQYSEVSSGTGTGSYTSELQFLEPNTKYYFRAYATNSVGTAFGSQIEFTTLPPLIDVIYNHASLSGLSGIGGSKKYFVLDVPVGQSLLNISIAGGTGDCNLYIRHDQIPTLTQWDMRPLYFDNNESVDFYNPQSGSYYIMLHGFHNYAGVTLSVSYTSPVILPTVSTTAPSNVTHNSVSTGGNVSSDGGAAVTGRGMVYATTQFPTTTTGTKVTSSGTTGTFTRTLTGLSASTTYYARAYATNSAGDGYGDQITFTTLPPVLATVSTSALTSISHNSATLGGNVTNAGGGTVSERGVVYATFPSPTTLSGVKVLSDSGTGNFTSTLSGLAANTVYYARAYAINSAGTAYGSTEWIFTTLVSSSAPGALDLGFDPGTGADSSVRTIAVQADGKVLIAGDFTSYNGTTRNRIARLNSNGSLDTSFDPGTGADSVRTIAVQADGKVLIAGDFTSYNGTTRNRIARLNSNGSLDTSFDPGTGASSSVYSVAVQADGKVLITGNFISYNGTGRNYVARLNSNGSLDTSFDPGTGASSSVYSVAVQADGKVLITGNFISYNGTTRNRIARLNSNGSLDTSFDPGTGANNAVYSVAVQADGKVLIGGSFTSYNGTERNRIARLNSNGSLDSSFDPGTGVGSTLRSIAVQADGKVLIGGSFTSYNGTERNRIARLNSNGSLDSSFNPGAGSGSLLNSVAVQADGKVLIGGSFTNYNGTTRNRIARLHNTAATQTLSVAGSGQADWVRGGSAPELSRASFELSTNGGSTWSALGVGTRIASTPNWRITGLALPASGQLRARGVTNGGIYNGSSGLVEQVISFTTQTVTRIVALSGDLAFGGVPEGQTATRTLTIQNTGNSALSVASISYPAGFSGNWSSGSIAAGGSQNVTVTFAPTATQSYSGNITVNSNATSGTNTRAVSGAGTVLVTVLGNIQTLENRAGAEDSMSYYVLDVPAGQALLSIEIFGGTGDCDLYIRRGSLPTLSAWDYFLNMAGNDEKVEVNNPASGSYYIMLHGWNAYSGVSLKVRYASPADLPTVTTASVSGITHNSAIGGGNVTHAGNAGPVTERGFVIAITPDPTSIDDLSVHAGSGTGSFTEYASSLIPSTTYYVKAYAVNIAGKVYGDQVSFTTQAVTQIVALSGDLAFGSVQTGQTATRTLTIQNTGNSTLSVTGISYPAGFTGNWSSGYIGAGDSQNVTVTFSPTVAQSYSGNITVTSNATSGTNTRAVSGSGTALQTRIIGLSGDLAFGNVTTGQTATRTLTISNTGNSPLNVTGVSYPAGFSGNWSSGSIAAGGSQNVTVTFTPTAAQSYSGNISVSSDATSGTNTRAVSGTGSATPTRIIALSGDLAFGSVQIGQTATRTLTLQNTGNSALNVTGITYPTGFSGNWSSGSIPASGSQNVTVTFSPTAAQSYSGNVTVTSNATSGTHTRAVSGTGIITLPGVTTTAHSNLTHNSVSTGGNVISDGGAAVIERGVVYATTQNPTTSSPGKVVSGSGTGSFTANLTGLNPGTTYYARAYAINSAGPGYGQQISFTTNLGQGNQQYYWSNFAGKPGGEGNVDGTGSAARFSGPGSVAVDDSGNVYVADTWNNTIRKVTPAGVVTTLAGSAGQHGSADGTGSDARFSGPSGVAVDGLGNVYVADTWNNTIRKVTPAGVTTTLAGSAGQDGSADGTGGNARFNNPYGVAVDGSGNVYVADTFNHTIRKITPAGLVTTLAGSAQNEGSADGSGSVARFSYPLGITVDAGGNIHVADTENHMIRKLSPAGVVTTLAGSANNYGSLDGTGSAARFSEPGSVAVDGNGNVYVADTSNSTIRRITPAGVVTTLAGSANNEGSTDGTGVSARFYVPRGVAVDSAGNVYVADSANFTIRKVTSAGAVTTLAGSPGNPGSMDGSGNDARFQRPGSVAVDVSGNVYVADTWNSTIRKITSAGLATTMAGSVNERGSADGTGNAALFSGPSGVAVDGSGNIYVADTENSTIRKITPIGVVTTLAGMAGEWGSEDGTGSAARFYVPSGVAVDGGGNVYVADTWNNTIRKVTPAGVVATLAGSAGQDGSGDGIGSDARFSGPSGVAVDGQGNVYVADTWNSTIRKITPAGVVTTLAGSAGQWGSTDGVGNAALFNAPSGVAVDGSGNVYVADTGNSTIRKVTSTGEVTTIGGAPGVVDGKDGLGLAARFAYPNDVAVSADGSLFVCDSGNHRISQGAPDASPALPVVAVSAPAFITHHSAVVSANVIHDGGASVIERGVVFATTPNPTTTSGNKIVSGSGLGVFSCDLTGLSPATTYYVQAFATNSAGTAHSGQTSFTTQSTSGQPPDWQTSAGKENSMTVYAQVDNAGVRIDAPGSMLAVFEGGVVAGVASPINGPAGLFYQLTVWSNLASVGNLPLKVYDAATGEIHDIKEKVNFTANGVLGLINAPVLFTVQPPVVEQVVPLVTGWNWLSFNALPETPTVTNVLGAYTPQDNDLIKGVAGSATYFGGSWFPATFAIEPGKMYMLRRQQAGGGTFTVTGPPADPTHTLSLVAGWNWLGYTPQAAQVLGTAMGSLSLADNDLVKSQQDGTATFFGGQWFPGTVMMQPGRGYLLRLAQSQSFTYDGTSGASAAPMAFEPEASETASDAPGWMVPVGKENSMTVYAAVQMDGTPVTAAGSLLAAFDGMEVAGVAEVLDGPAGKLFQLTIWSDSASKPGLALKVYEADTGAVRDIEEPVNFATNAILGGISTPLAFNAVPLVASEFEFSSHAYKATGNPSFVELEIIRTVGTSPASVSLSTSNGMAGVVPPFAAAVAGVDYTAVNTVVNFAQGEMSKTVPVTLIPRTGKLPNRRFIATLSNPSNGMTLGSVSIAEVRLLAPDTTKPVLVVTSPIASAKTLGLPSSFFVFGTAGDAQGIDRVEMEYDGETYTTVPGLGGAAKLMAVPWAFEFTPKSEGPVSLIFTAYDFSGNSTTVRRAFSYERRYEMKVLRSVPDGVLPDKAGTVSVKALPAKDAALIVKPNFHGIPAAQLPSSWSVKAGASLTFTAVAKAGHLFSHWTGLPEEAQVRGNVAALVMPAEDVTVTAVFVENPLTQGTFAALGARPVFQGLLRPNEMTQRDNANVGFLSAALVSSTGSLSGKVWMDGLVTSFSGVLHGNGTVWFKAGAVLTSKLPFAGRELFLSWSASGLTMTVTRQVNELSHLSNGLAKPPRYSRGTPVRGPLLDAKGRQGYYTLALPAVEQSPMKPTELYPQGAGQVGLTLLANGTLRLAGILAEGSKITASAFLMAGDGAEIFLVLPTPGGRTREGSLLGTLVFDETQAASDVSSADMQWFRPVAQTRTTLVQAYRAGWPSGITLDAVGALYDGSVPVQTALGLAATAQGGNAALVFQDGKLVDEVGVAFNLDGNKVIKLDAKDKTWSLVLSPRTGIMTGSFTPDWSNPARKLPSFRGVLLQKSMDSRGQGFFLSNPLGDMEPESGSVVLE